MKIFLSLFLSFVFAYGGIFDFAYSYKGEKLQKEGKLKEALQYYKKVENKTDAIHYNMGNIYYKEKKYKEAITSYQKIKKDILQYKKLHNLGNSYAQENKLTEAIQSYKEALKIKKDKDTLFNLELLEKKQQEQNENQSNKEENKPPKNDIQEKNETQKGKKEEITREDDEKQKTKVEEKVRKSNELSDLEEKKWSQMLENRDIKTLMIPMTKSGEKNDANIKPW